MRRILREGGPYVLAGKRVAVALGVRAAYFQRVEFAGSWAVVVPHPSGVNRWWNDGQNLGRAKRFLRRLARGIEP